MDTASSRNGRRCRAPAFWDRMSATRSQGTYDSAKYRRIASRRGPLKAIIAAEHAMLIAIWNLLATCEFNNDPGGDF